MEAKSTRHWLRTLEVAAGALYVAILVGPQADLGGGTVPILMLLLGGAAIALHRTHPGVALGLLSAQAALPLIVGFGGRTPSIEMWINAPLVLFSAAFFGARSTRFLALAAGSLAGLAIVAKEIELVLSSCCWDPGGGPTLLGVVEFKAPMIAAVAAALFAPPLLGMALRGSRRAPAALVVTSPAPSPASLAEFAQQRSLSRREQRVFELAAQGMTNAEIAAAEHVSEATVKSHMTRVLAKVGARDRVQLAIEAHRRGLFGPASESVAKD